MVHRRQHVGKLRLRHPSGMQHHKVDDEVAVAPGGTEEERVNDDNVQRDVVHEADIPAVGRPPQNRPISPRPKVTTHIVRESSGMVERYAVLLVQKIADLFPGGS